MKHLVTGGAGFIGSNLIKKLISKNEEVICLDNFLTGDLKNLDKFLNNRNLQIINHDIVEPKYFKINKIWHLAAPASPLQYQKYPIETSKIILNGMFNILELAKINNATLLFASSSEVYGDPEEHPQDESYKGSVNQLSQRSCYVEGKRMAESLCFDYIRTYKIDIKIARIFNAYGPHMQPNDGRVISNFICQALSQEPLTIYGDGSHSRSFCYIDDLIEGLLLFMNSEYSGPINFGNKEEINIEQLSILIKNKLNHKLKNIYLSKLEDEPTKRLPSLKKVKKLLKWEPKVYLGKGLDLTIDYFKGRI